MKLTPQLMPVQIDAKHVDSAESEGPPFELPDDTWSEQTEAKDNQAVREDRVDAREQDTEIRDQRARDEQSADSEDRRDNSNREHRREEREGERDDVPVFAHGVEREEKRPARARREVERTDVGLLLNPDLKDRRVIERRLDAAPKERALFRQVEDDVTPRLSTRQEPKVAREVLKQSEIVTTEKSDRTAEQRPAEDRIAGSKLEAVDRPQREGSTQKVEARSTAIDKLAQMRAVDRSRGRDKGISIARDLLQNVREARIDESRAADRVLRATSRGEAVRTAVTENVAKEVHNVFKKASDKRTQTLESARESHRAAEQGEESSQEEFTLASGPSSNTVSTQAPVVATQSVTAVSGSASASAVNTSSTMGLDPEVSEALRNVRIEDPGDTILRLNETEAGQLEVRIRSSGDDLVVLVKAEEQALRQKMIDGLPELRKALDRAELVAGRVDVAEYGAFENEARGDGDNQSFFESAFEDSLDQQASDDGEPQKGTAGDSNPETASTNRAAAQRSPRGEDGRLHVIV